MSCGFLNPIPDCEMRPQIIQCVECGKDIVLTDAPSIINRVIQALPLSRRTFNKEAAWSLLSVFISIMSPFWSHVVNKMFFGTCEIKQKPRTFSLNCELGELKLTGHAVTTVIKNKDAASDQI
jgi:hypothetical protein